MTRPSWMTGELAKPHCAAGTLKKPESSTPRSFFQQQRAPSGRSTCRPSEPKNATSVGRRWPSVELACVALVWRLIFGTPRVRGLAPTAPSRSCLSRQQHLPGVHRVILDRLDVAVEADLELGIATFR